MDGLASNILRAAARIQACSGGLRACVRGQSGPAAARRSTSSLTGGPDGVPRVLGLDTMARNGGRRHGGSTAAEPGAHGGGRPYRALDFGRASGGAKWAAGAPREACNDPAPAGQPRPIAERMAALGGPGRFPLAFKSRLGEWLDDLLDILPPETSSGARAGAGASGSVPAAPKGRSLERAVLEAPVLR